MGVIDELNEALKKYKETHFMHPSKIYMSRKKKYLLDQEIKDKYPEMIQRPDWYVFCGMKVEVLDDDSIFFE